MSGGIRSQTETKRDEKRPRGLTALSNMPEKHRCFLEGGASWWIFKEDVRFFVPVSKYGSHFLLFLCFVVVFVDLMGDGCCFFGGGWDGVGLQEAWKGATVVVSW